MRMYIGVGPYEEMVHTWYVESSLSEDESDMAASSMCCIGDVRTGSALAFLQ